MLHATTSELAKYETKESGGKLWWSIARSCSWFQDRVSPNFGSQKGPYDSRETYVLILPSSFFVLADESSYEQAESRSSKCFKGLCIWMNRIHWLNFGLCIGMDRIYGLGFGFRYMDCWVLGYVVNEMMTKKLKSSYWAIKSEANLKCWLWWSNQSIKSTETGIYLRIYLFIPMGWTN